jgi:hypothetical protein
MLAFVVGSAPSVRASTIGLGLGGAPGGSACGATGSVGTGPDGVTSYTAVAPSDGSGNFSVIAGCYARGNNFLGVTNFGTYTNVTGRRRHRSGFCCIGRPMGDCLGPASQRCRSKQRGCRLQLGSCFDKQHRHWQWRKCRRDQRRHCDCHWRRRQGLFGHDDRGRLPGDRNRCQRVRPGFRGYWRPSCGERPERRGRGHQRHEGGWRELLCLWRGRRCECKLRNCGGCRSQCQRYWCDCNRCQRYGCGKGTRRQFGCHWC